MKCRNCGLQSKGKFCPNCGEQLEIHRITLPHLLHEIVHTFTHLEKGFFYTLKNLITDPGRMQRLYLEGDRVRHQRPFSMFFICSTISALSLFWINRFSNLSLQPGQEAFSYFLQHYYVLLHVALFPFYTLVTWVLFIRSKYNYAEILVLGMYMVAVMLLLLIPIYALSFFRSSVNIQLMQAMILGFYNIWTFIRFFNKTPWWLVLIFSIINMLTNYFVYFYIMEWMVLKVLTK
ncbi:MAG: DUF3667 domain-containing protein [Chitinophagaceae bacterium]